MLGRSSDAARVEVLGRVAEPDVGARAAEVEDARPFHEKRPPLRQELLECGEVHERRIRLDLTEVGVDGGIERKVRGDAVLQVEPRAAEVAVAVVKGIPGSGAVVRAAAEAVRQQLQPSRGGDVAQADQVTEARRVPRLGLLLEYPLGELVLAEHPAKKVDAPHLRAHLGEPQLRERDPHLHDPAERVDRGRHLPHGIPGAVADEEVVAAQVVQLHARWIHGELERRAVIMVTVEVDVEDVALGVVVAAAQAARDLRRRVVVQPRAHVNRVGVVQQHHGRRFGGSLAFVRVGLGEAADRDRPGPRRIIEPAVERRRVAHPHRRHRRRHATVGVAQRRGAGVGRLWGEQQQRRDGKQHSRPSGGAVRAGYPTNMPE